MTTEVNALYAKYLDHTDGDKTAAAFLTLASLLHERREGASLPHSSPDKPLTVRQAADFLGVSIDSIYDLCKNGRIRYFKIGRALRIDRKALADFQKTTAVATKQPLRHLRLGHG